MRNTDRDLDGLRLGLSVLSIVSVSLVVAGVLLVGYGLWAMVH